MPNLRIRLLLLLIFVLPTYSLSVSAEKLKPIGIIYFPLASGLPMYVAMEKGYYRREGLAVTLERTPDSKSLISQLAENKFQIAMASFDNFVAYQESQHIAPYQEGNDLFVFWGLAQTNLSLVVSSDIKTYEDIKGREIAVDAKTTGFAFVLLKMLETNGLIPDDYQLVSIGSTDRRWKALQSGKTSITLLTGAYAKQAAVGGFHVLDNSLDVLGSYQGTVLASNQRWAEQNPDDLHGFSKATWTALQWLFDPNNAAEAALILSNYIHGLTPEAAAKILQNLVSGNGLSPNGSLNDAGVETVLSLRSQYGQPSKQLTEPEKYIDLSFLNPISEP